MKFEVTQEDIKLGIRKDCEKCPVASAIRRLFKDSQIVVCLEAIWIGNRRYETPPLVADFIDTFDILKNVQPFTFELPIEP